MSVDATRWAWVQQGLKCTEKMVLLSLADRAGESHECWPSIARLEADTCLDRKTVMSVIFRLEERGLLVVDRSNGNSNVYRLLVVGDRASLFSQSSTENGTSPKNGTSTKNGTRPVPKTGPHQSQKRDTHQYQKRDTNLKEEPKKNLKENLKEKNNKKEDLDLLARFGVIGDLANDFIKHRKTKKAGISETALKGFEREALKAGVSVSEAVVISIERGWIGFQATWLKNDFQHKPSGGRYDRGTGSAYEAAILSTDF
jgi:hypothetical protein